MVGIGSLTISRSRESSGSRRVSMSSVSYADTSQDYLEQVEAASGSKTIHNVAPKAR